jgi:26S proteasome non-ATPase regulatory subunit 5
MAEITEILNKIAESPDENRKDLLETLRTALSRYTRAEQLDVMSNISIDVLFECLGSSDEEQIELTCSILKNLMFVLDPVDCLQKYHESILQGFHHPMPDVRSLVVAQLNRCIETSAASIDILCSEYQDLIIASINQLASDELSSAKGASEFLINLARLTPGSNFLLGPAGIDSFKKILSNPRYSEMIRFRLYDTLARLAGISPEHSEKLDERNLIILPLSEVAFNSNDPLNQMNALEILSTLAETKHGIDAVEKAGVFEKLAKLCHNWRDDPMSGLIFPGVLKFIGKIGAIQPPKDELTAIVIDAILNSDDDVPLITVALESLAYIGCTIEGKAYLDQKPSLKSCFDKSRTILEDAPSEFRCRVMDAFAVLFGTAEENQSFLPRWFVLIFPRISVLFSLVQQPFPDIRLSALHFLGAIAHLEWAQKHYLRIPGVLEFLIDRSCEPNKDCALAKFKIVSIIVESPTVTKILSMEDMGRLKIHIDQGPFYATAQATVAIE